MNVQMNKGILTGTDRIYVAGHRGMVGAAILRNLQGKGAENLILRRHSELDLTNQKAVNSLFEHECPEYVFLAAARVGGIYANSAYPADFIYQNLMIEANIIQAAHKAGAKRLLFLGSSCIYPKMARQPMEEGALLKGKLEPTNEPYAVAKIAGIKLCESYNRQYGTDFRSVMPTNLYGPGDNFDLENGHVIAALIRRFHEAKENESPFVEVWGSGEPKREFLHVDDLATACIFVMQLSKEEYMRNTQPMLSHINVGTGEDISIRELAQLIREVVGYKGDIRYNTEKPDGVPRKLLNVERLNSLGWKATIPLRDGLIKSYKWFLENLGGVRR